MTDAEIRDIVLRALASIAPELDSAAIRPDVSFRDQLDLDSMDFLNFVIALHEELGVEIPDEDASKLVTLDGAVEYLAAAMR